MPRTNSKTQAPKKKDKVKNNKANKKVNNKKIDNKRLEKEIIKAKREAKRELRQEMPSRHLFAKTILWIIILALFVICISCLALYFYRQQQDKIRSTKQAELQSIVVSENKTIEYGVELTYNTLLNNCVDESKLTDDIKATILVDDKEIKENGTIKFDKVGTHTVRAIISEASPTNKNIDFVFIPFKFEVTDVEYKVTATATYSVKDTQKPVIEGAVDKKIIEGTSINLKEGIKAIDPVDGELGIIIDGSVDIYTPGVYNLKAKAADKNGNEAEADFTITVMAIADAPTNKEGTAAQDTQKPAKTVVPVGTKIFTVEEGNIIKYYILPDIPGVESLVNLNTNN